MRQTTFGYFQYEGSHILGVHSNPKCMPFRFVEIDFFLIKKNTHTQTEKFMCVVWKKNKHLNLLSTKIHKYAYQEIN